MFSSSDKIYYCEVAGNSTNWEVETTAVYRDVSAWYHLVLRQDTTQASANDRVRIYINNVQQTLGTNTQPAQNRGTQINTADVHKIGKGNTGEYFDGFMSHIHWCDGQSYAPTEFGETDSNGVWKIKTSPSVTYGTNGFFILKNGNSVTDQGGGSHNFTVGGGTLTDMKDSPSNVFATINPLSGYHGDKAVLEFGNNGVDGSTGGGSKWYGASTLGFHKGKFYCEVKNVTTSNPSLSVGVSFNPAENQYQNHAPGARNSDIATENYSGNIVINNANVVTGYGSTWSASGDICMLAVDMDNNKFYIGKNGTWADSDNPSTNTGGYDMSSVSGHTESQGIGFFSFGSTSGTYMNEFTVNFGNGYFGTTAVSSAGTNASGHGIFEYNVPTGYTALCTKGLDE